MTAEQFSKTCESLSERQQIGFLLQLSALLTIDARRTYVPGTDDLADPSRLREFNEFQHRIAFHLVHLFNHNVQRYPDDVFSHILWDYSEAVGSSKTLITALEENKHHRLHKQSPAA